MKPIGGGPFVAQETSVRFIRFFLGASRALTLAVMFIGASVLIGWKFQLLSVLAFADGYSPMTPNTACCFFLLGGAFLLYSLLPARHGLRLAATAAGFLVCAIAGITLLEYLLRLDLGLDRILFPEQTRRIMPALPGRMSPISTVSFLLSSVSLLLFFRPQGRRIKTAQTLALCCAGIALFGLVGYAYGVSGFYRLGFYKPMALNTALCFLALSLALLLSRPDQGVIAVLSSASEGGIMARRMLGLVVGLPFLFGWSILAFQVVGLCDIQFGLSMLVLLIIVAFVFLTWTIAEKLHQIDQHRQEMEEVLRENEAHYRTIFETTGAATAIFEEDKSISLVNSEFEKLSGYAKAQIETMKRWTEFVADQRDLERMEEYHRLRRIDPNAAPRNYEFKFRSAGGQVKDVFMTVSMIPGTRKSIASMLDITERKRVEQMKSDFVSLVSHQLKTPAAELSGYIYNMLSGLTGELTARQREYLEDMQEINGKNYRLISDLLNVSRIERGVISLDIKSVPLKTVVEAALSDYYDRIRRRGLSLELEGLDQELYVLADRDKTVEAISNVINNALKFTASGAIRFRIFVRDESACVEISDTGSGIPPDRLAKLFTRELTLDGAPVAGGGTGLGMYIAKQFMVLQHGDISVRSTEGEGSVFCLSLPLAQG